MSKKPWFDRLMSIEKKYLYLAMFIVVVIPFVLNMTYAPTISPEVKNIYNEVEAIYEHNQKNPDQPMGLLLTFDYSPSTNAELDPMTMSVLRHAFMRDVPVVTWSGFIDTIDLARRLTAYIAKEYGAVYGEDFVFMGYPYPMTAAVIAFGTDIRSFLVKDYYGNLSTELPLLNRINNYKQIGMIVTISGTSYPRFWVTYANTLYGKKIGTGITAVSAAEFYPFLQTKQMIGMMGGLRGAAEYEELTARLETELIGSDTETYLSGLYEGKDLAKYNEQIYTPAFSEDEIKEHVSSRYTARKGMSSQVFSHFYVIILIVVGNLGYYFKRKAEKKR